MAILDTAEAMRTSTYTVAGMVPDSPYRFERVSSVPTETMANRGNGSPVNRGTGLVRSAFRPSDDATTFQFHVPSNMMLAKYLELCAEIMAGVEKVEERVAALTERQGRGKVVQDEVEEEEEDEEEEGDGEKVADRMKRMAKEIKKGIEKFGKVMHPEFGEILAYETDGYFSYSTMVSAAPTRPTYIQVHPTNNPPGRRQPSLPPLSPPNQLPLPHQRPLPQHAQVHPLTGQPLLRPRARPERHRRAAHRARYGVAHVPHRGHHDERRRRRNQGHAAPDPQLDRLPGPNPRERQRA